MGQRLLAVDSIDITDIRPSFIIRQEIGAGAR
jgi:hypothetical protein